MAGVLKRLLGDGHKRGHFMAGGKEIVCPHCGHKEFEEGEAQLNTGRVIAFESGLAEQIGGDFDLYKLQLHSVVRQTA